MDHILWSLSVQEMSNLPMAQMVIQATSISSDDGYIDLSLELYGQFRQSRILVCQYDLVMVMIAIVVPMVMIMEVMIVVDLVMMMVIVLCVVMVMAVAAVVIVGDVVMAVVAAAVIVGDDGCGGGSDGGDCSFWTFASS